MRLNQQLDQRVDVNSRVHTSRVLGVGKKKAPAEDKRKSQTVCRKKVTHMENPIHWSTKHSKQSLAEELGAALETGGAQVTDTTWQVFRLSRFWDEDKPLACRWWRQRADGITADRESHGKLWSHNQSADHPWLLWTFLLGQQIWLQRQINRVSDWWW